jgi:hypothetical protein
MRRCAVFASVVLLLVPARADAWSFDVHKYITRRAIELLPDAIRPFFSKYQVSVVEHSIDPDLWRIAGFEEEPPNHFLDIDAYGSYPFNALPRDYGAAAKKFGRTKVQTEGLLPWRATEIYDKLTKAFDEQKTSSYGFENMKFFAAVISHYVADAHVPLHAVKNYDGQLTNQHGVHSRFEAELFRRFESKVTIAPRPIAPVRHPRDYMFATILDSYKAAAGVLDADRRAAKGRIEYDDEYFALFFGETQAILERRMSDAIAGVAAMIAGAWEAAGRPDVKLEFTYTPRKVKAAA